MRKKLYIVLLVVSVLVISALVNAVSIPPPPAPKEAVCVQIAATSCAPGRGCPGGLVIPALGCPNDQVCQNGACAVPLAEAQPAGIEGDLNNDGCVNLVDIYQIGLKVKNRDPAYTKDRLFQIKQNVNLWCVPRQE